MSKPEAKFITVPSNGQISIGKTWAGRQVKVEQVSPTDVVISSGVFIPDSQATFYTKEATATLGKYNDWEKSHPPKKSDLKALKAKLAKKAR